ncbi:uncharacterized protein EDB91DRAFT_1083801 [Suillus paluster]|uniref:uncharacterized protein n=1 Tax=Suillus paluster TaxID=48578 RepID=UPI001B86DBD4|nr:uncharacterized protein EDB91DRAFT_1083801 [Suillus paluster]KAG1735352.1 hypothetical protein EDB91DRAFT_1083801 [Suillus paluster]
MARTKQTKVQKSHSIKPGHGLRRFQVMTANKAEIINRNLLRPIADFRIPASKKELEMKQWKVLAARKIRYGIPEPKKYGGRDSKPDFECMRVPALKQVWKCWDGESKKRLRKEKASLVVTSRQNAGARFLPAMVARRVVPLFLTHVLKTTDNNLSVILETDQCEAQHAEQHQTYHAVLPTTLVSASATDTGLASRCTPFITPPPIPTSMEVDEQCAGGEICEDMGEPARDPTPPSDSFLQLNPTSMPIVLASAPASDAVLASRRTPSITPLPISTSMRVSKALVERSMKIWVNQLAIPLRLLIPFYSSMRHPTISRCEHRRITCSDYRLPHLLLIR